MAEYIGACLDSILAQSFQDYEVIIIDDGSSDSTGSIIDQYATQDQRFRVIHKANEGVSQARNDGIDLAQGDYILFYDGDDFIEKNTLSRLYNLGTNEKVDTLIYGYHRWQDGQILKTCTPIMPEGIYEDEAIQNELLPWFLGIPVDGINRWIQGDEMGLYRENAALWRTMVKREVIVDNMLRFDRRLKVGEDTIFTTCYLAKAKKALVINECFYYLVIRPTSTIFQYELNPFAKADGKLKLIQIRQELTDHLAQDRSNKLNVASMWLGTVMMSYLEMAFLFSQKHSQYKLRERYRGYKNFVTQPLVKSKIRQCQPNLKPNIRSIPLLLTKWQWATPLFMATMVLHMVGYEIQREL